ncbi:MAG: hypothetical protein MJ169_05215 [Treponema sp.]|nr:hypothetical protein [Treponema sp.]
MPVNKKQSEKLFRILLAAGFLLIGVGLSALILLPADEVSGFLPYFFLALLFISGIVVYIALILRKALVFYIGFNFCVYAVMALIVVAYHKPFFMSTYWPVLLITFGAALMPAGYIKYRKMRIVYALPAAAMVVLGVFFCLFSFKVIKVPFKVVLAYFFPAILVCAGLVLVIYYIYGVHNKNQFLEENDTMSDFSGDDL